MKEPMFYVNQNWLFVMYLQHVTFTQLVFAPGVRHRFFLKTHTPGPNKIPGAIKCSLFKAVTPGRNSNPGGGRNHEIGENSLKYPT